MMDLFDLAPTFDDPIGMLRACHRRIERALAAIERIAAREQHGPLDAPAREALRQVLRYFGTGVPRHAADEEESLFPRVRAAAAGRSLTALAIVESLERDHTAADAAHRELDSLGEELLRTVRFQKVEERARFNELIARLRQLYREHIRIEDDELFPLAAMLVNADERDGIGSEMAHRRGIDPARHRELVAGLESRPWIRRPLQNQDRE